MSYQPDPRFFDWGARIQEGIQGARDEKRRNALMDMQQQRFAWEGQDREAAATKEAAAKSARKAFLRKFNLPEELADDPDAPELYVELMKMSTGHDSPADVQTALWYASTTDENRRAFDITKRAQALGRIAEIGGVPTVVDTRLSYPSSGYPSGGGNVPTMAPYEPTQRPTQKPSQTPSGARPLSTLENEAAAAETIKAAEGRGTVTGQEQAKRQEAINAKLQNITNMDQLLDLAVPLIQLSTGSLVGSAVDKVTNAFGVSLSGDQAIGALQPIAASLLANVPRMEGPQSDADRIQYERAAGDIANPATPREKRIAAVRQIRQINSKYRALNKGTTNKQRSVVRSGTHNGRRVVEYSDGTIEYADQPR